MFKPALIIAFLAVLGGAVSGCSGTGDDTAKVAE
jgi:hypothetical protein